MIRYFRLNKVKDNPFRVIIISLIIFLILLYGYITDDYLMSSIMSLGLFSLFYYKNLSMRDLLLRLFLIGLSMGLSFVLGLVSSLHPFFKPFVVGLVAFATRFVMRLYGISGPGSLFPVMLAGMGASLNFSLEKIPLVFLYFFIGVIVSIFGGIIIKLLDKREVIIEEKASFKERFYKHPLVIVDSFFYSVALFVTVYISEGLQLDKPYWMTMGCASILLAENLKAMRERHVQFIFGALVGLSIAGFFLSIQMEPMLLIILTTFFYGLSQHFIVRNYGVANFFINPMVLLLSSLLKETQTISLIKDRFIGIFFGSFIGFGVAWLMNYALNHYLKIIIESDEVKDLENK